MNTSYLNVAFLITLLIIPYYAISRINGNNKSAYSLSMQSFLKGKPVLESGFSFGAANALTDIASNEYNRRPGLSDVQFRGFSPAVSAFARYRFNNFTSVRANFGVMRIRGNDSWSSNENVANRGKFYSNNIFEMVVLGELYLPRHLLNTRSGFSKTTFDLFVFGGLSGFYHSPKSGGPVTDAYDLMIQTDPNAFDKWQLALPLGAGAKWTVAHSWTFGLDFNMRYTFINYLDGYNTHLSNDNDIFFTTQLSFGFLIDSNNRNANQIPIKYVFGQRTASK